MAAQCWARVEFIEQLYQQAKNFFFFVNGFLFKIEFINDVYDKFIWRKIEIWGEIVFKKFTEMILKTDNVDFRQINWKEKKQY